MAEENEQVDGDFILIWPVSQAREIMFKMMSEYFNTMFKDEVKVVDIQTSEVGYSFSLVYAGEYRDNLIVGNGYPYVKREEEGFESLEKFSDRIIQQASGLTSTERHTKRNAKGRFVK